MYEDSIEYELNDWPRDIDHLVPYSMSWFRSLYVPIPFPMSNSALTHLLVKDKLVLENASNLTLYLSHYPDKLNTEQEIQTAKTNINLFMEYLIMMAPNLANITIVDIYLDLVLPKLSKLYQHMLDQLTRAVAGLDKRQLVARIDGGTETMHLGSLTHHGLTEIGFRGDSKIWNFELVRRCSKTLKSLILYDGSETANFTGLLILDEEYVVYPHLTSLHIYSKRTPVVLPTHPDFLVSFPRMRKLKISGQYPFRSNVVLRGNQGTLGYLSLEMSTGLIKVLENTGVFTAGSHPELRYVEMYDSEFIFGKPIEDRLVGLLSNMTGSAIRVDIQKLE